MDVEDGHGDRCSGGDGYGSVLEGSGGEDAL